MLNKRECERNIEGKREGMKERHKKGRGKRSFSSFFKEKKERETATKIDVGGEQDIYGYHAS